MLKSLKNARIQKCGALLTAAAVLAGPASAGPKIILISLDGATPRIVEQYLINGDLPANEGLGLLRQHGFRAGINQTVSPSLTAVGHVAIATGSIASKNDVVANTFHLSASPFTFNISGFGAPIGGYLIDGPAETPSPTAEPLWLKLRAQGKKVVTATWPGGDGVDVRVPGATNNAIVQPAAERTVDYTVPFGAFAGIGAVGFQLTTADFGLAPSNTVAQLTAAGKTSFSPVLQKTTTLETFTVGGANYQIQVAALDTTPDSVTNYDTLVFFGAVQGIQPGPFSLPSTGPAYVKASDKKSSSFYIEGSTSKAGCAFYVSRLEPDLSIVRICRYGANSIPRNTAVLADVDDINTHVGFWAPQADFRIPERLSPGFGTFPDAELEDIYEDQVVTFVDYQTRVALRAMQQKPDADLVMIYIEQPDGSEHQFLLTDPRQPTNPTNNASIGAGQDPAKVARYAGYVKTAYQTANRAVQRIIEAVGTDASGKPNADVIVTSDHGFDIFHTAVNLNALLAANGIPSTKVRAVTSGPAVNVYISLTNREPNGIVSPAEYITLQQQVVNILQGLVESNANYTLGGPATPIFDQVFARPLPANPADPSFGRGTNAFIGQDSGDVYALLKVGYNFDGAQAPVVTRLGDPAPVGTPVLSVPNFYGAHGYDPAISNMSSILYAAGPNIGQGTLPLARNIDIAPTILGAMQIQPSAQVDGSALPIGPLKLNEAASVKLHGQAGAFALPINLTGSTSIECREGFGWGDHSHLLVFRFNKQIVEAGAHITTGIGRVLGQPIVDGNIVYVILAGVRDSQTLTLSLDQVEDIYGGTIDTSVSLGFLEGDVTGDGKVLQDDVNAIKAADQSKAPVGVNNFRFDLDTNGRLNGSDVQEARGRIGNVLSN